MSMNIDPVHPITVTNLADSSGSEPRNPEIKEVMLRELRALNDGLEKNTQKLAKNIQMGDGNIQGLGNLKENLERIEEGVQELQNYQQTAVKKIFVFVIQGFQRMQEMGSSMIRTVGYPNVPMLQGTSQPVESQRDPDSASSPQPAEKKV